MHDNGLSYHRLSWTFRQLNFFSSGNWEQYNHTVSKTHTKKFLKQAYFIISKFSLTPQVKLEFCSWTKKQSRTALFCILLPKPLTGLWSACASWPCSVCFGCKPRKERLSHERQLVFTLSLPLSLPEKQCQLTYIKVCAAYDRFLTLFNTNLAILELHGKREVTLSFYAIALLPSQILRLYFNSIENLETPY